MVSGLAGRTVKPALLLFAVVSVCVAPHSNAAQTGIARARVLFVGNSLTSQNDLPAMLEALATQAGASITCSAVARANYSLEDHWKDGAALRALRRERWTHIVLQQGPSSLPDSQASLRDYAARFAAEARQVHAAVVLYGVWPPKARSGFFDAVTGSYARAAEDVGGALVPVGEGWRAAWRRDPSLALYAADDFHPSSIGTYMAALMFLQRLTGRSPVGLPPPGESRNRVLGDIRLDTAQLAVLQSAAAEANGRQY